MKSTLKKSVAGIASFALAGLSLAGCSESVHHGPYRPWGRCAVIGGATGAALGGGGAAGILSATGPSNDPRHDEMGTGAMIGVLVGGALGAIIGHYTCDPVIRPAAPTPVAATPPPPPPPPPPAKEKLVLRGVHFDFDKSAIRPGDAAVLDEVAAKLKENPDVSVEVNGYTDAIGTDRYNQGLSERRARSVVNYLEKAGIAADRLDPHGYGESHPVATNSTAEGRAQNRRVELVPKQ